MSDEIPAGREQEYEDLRSLLMNHAAVNDERTHEVAQWIARSALKPVHLWQGMGVEGRAEVRAVMREFFPTLEAENNRDMRWKKFLYRRLCGWSGFSA
jgi:nitrogen fixation protein NifQ